MANHVGTKQWNDLVDMYKSQLIGEGNSYREVPYDFQVKTGKFTLVTPADGSRSYYVASGDMHVLPDTDFYGAIIVEQNDRFFAIDLSEEIPTDLFEVDLDAPDLLEAHVILHDNGEDGSGDSCPNTLKNKKPYKTLNAPIKIIPQSDAFQIVYTVEVRIYIPLDSCGGQYPAMEYSWLKGDTLFCPFALIIMPAKLFLKTSAITAVPGEETPTCPTGTAFLRE